MAKKAKPNKKIAKIKARVAKKAKKVIKKRRIAGKKPAKKNKGARMPFKAVLESASQGELIGEITHFYGGIGVGIVKVLQPISIGDNIKIKGPTSDFSQRIESMQYEHQSIDKAEKDKEVGIKVKDKVREGDKIYRI